MLYIKSNNDLHKICKSYEKAEYIAIDTEFIREKTYWPKLCLIQVFDGKKASIIDPLVNGIDLEPLIDLLENDSITKIFHAGRQDIEIFYNLTNNIPKNIFDTQIAAMVCGFGESIGYERLVSRLLNKKIDKTSRFTNWEKRPLSKKQKDYAISDVTHLFDLYPIIKKQVFDNKRENWVKEEMNILISKETYKQDPDNAWKKLKIRSSDEKSISILFHLAKWREKKSQELDIPRGKLLRDEAIYEISSSQPTSEKEISELRSFSRINIKLNSINEILEEIRNAKSVKINNLPEMPNHNRLSQGISAKISILKILLDSISVEYGVAQKLIANKDDLEKLIMNDNANIKTLRGWRYEIFGKKAVDFKNGRIGITMDSGNVVLKEI